MAFHTLTEEQILNFFHTSKNGLSSTEAIHKLNELGPNVLQEIQRKTAISIFLGQFKDVMILILAAAALLSGIVGDLTDTMIILVILLLNATIGFVQEYRAESAMAALKKMSITNALTKRDGRWQSLASSALVPGDIVKIEAGNVVPADIRILEDVALRADEASLTGESVAVEKHAGMLPQDDTPLGDRHNMLFKGTTVVHGRGIGVVVATGMQTELGKIAGLLQKEVPKTPLQARMERFGEILSYIILAICLILFITGLLRGENLMTMLLLAISLAVAAIPEALPALITIALSRGAARLVQNRALVRKLPAVETLGSVSFICSDKTGTLTLNKMTVIETWQANSQSPIPLTTAMALNQDTSLAPDGKRIGEPTEVALAEYAYQNNSSDPLISYPRVAELPFDSERKSMTTIHTFGQQFLVITKGATERIAQCLRPDQPEDALADMSEAWAMHGQRVLAYAYKILDTLPEPLQLAFIESNLALLGLVGMIDPPRPAVKEAIAECKGAGITPVMITGDHPATARTIAKEIGIFTEESHLITGQQLKQMTDAELLEKVEKIAVYARVSPEQKLRIVTALQQCGHFVAMTGDGVNDAPSLRAANIGIAMGITGTDVSKEAAHLILLDDAFGTIVQAVKEGRRIFDNIRKFVKYIMTCNGAEIWLIFLAPLLLMPIPLLPIHILWINLVTDGLPALALSTEPAERDIMRLKPRPASESIFAHGVGIHIIWVGLFMAGVALCTQAWALHIGSPHWQTMVFTVISLAQLGHVLAIRSERFLLVEQGLFSNPSMFWTIIGTFILQMAVIYVPWLNQIFKTQPLTFSELVLCLALSASVFIAVEIEKLLKRHIKKTK